MTKFIHIISRNALMVFFSLFALQAQAQSDVEMADLFRQDGKIYVVIAVMLIVVSALFAYLFVVDRKVSKLEKKIKESGD
jgi:uncharacterized membrane protein YcjF (UPF0283 family)